MGSRLCMFSLKKRKGEKKRKEKERRKTGIYLIILRSTAIYFADVYSMRSRLFERQTFCVVLLLNALKYCRLRMVIEFYIRLFMGTEQNGKFLVELCPYE